MSDDLVMRLRVSTNYDNRSDAADLIESQAAHIAELETEVKMWRNEDKKKQTACEQMGNRIAELEAALQKIVDRTHRAHPMSYVGDYCSIAQAALAGGKKDD